MNLLKKPQSSEELAQMISDITGVDKDTIIVNVVTDEHGKIIRVEVYVDNDKSADTIVSVINNLDKNEGECHAFFLCHSTHAYVSIEFDPVEEASKLPSAVLLMIIQLFSLMIVRINA